MAIIDGPFIPKGEVNGVLTEKLPNNWLDEEPKKAFYDLKERNIFIIMLSVKVYYSISHHKSAISIWNALQVLYEGTEDFKDSKSNTLS